MIGNRVEGAEGSDWVCSEGAEEKGAGVSRYLQL